MTVMCRATRVAPSTDRHGRSLRAAASRWTVAVLVLLLAGCSASTQGTANRLAVGPTHDRTLAAGETHSYPLVLDSGQFVLGRVDQRGVGVTVTVTGPDAQQVARFHSPTVHSGPKHFQFTTEAAGEHTIQMTTATDTVGGRYTFRLQRQEPVATDPAGKVDQMLARFERDTPGVLVAVLRNGQIDFSHSAGSANLTHDVPFTDRTVTNIGSTSKQFTGFALALLESRGQLSLDDDVRKYIPELPDFGETVTLRNLLTHTTGYREFINTLLLGGRQILGGDQVAPEEVVQVVRRQPRLQNPVGAEFNYNNTAFGLATIVLERVTGRVFADWMREEVFLPLGMEHTWVRGHPGKIIPNSSAGYTVAPGGFQEVKDLGASQGAGGIYTTAGDLARWMNNLQTGALGGPDVRRAMTDRFVLTTGDTTSYGLGLFVDRDRGLERLHHGGADVAHRSSFVYYPTLQAGFVVLSNHGAMPGGFERQVADAFFGSHMEAPRPAAAAAPAASPDIVRSDLFAAYAGRYSLEVMAGAVLTISVEGDGEEVYLQVADQPRIRLTPTSDSTFTLTGVDASVTFHADAEGAVNELTLHQAGAHRARRIDDAVPMDLAPLVGRYFSEELETFYDVAAENGALQVTHRRFGTVTLTHSKDYTFTGSLPIAELTFERAPGGEVSGFRVGNVRARDIWFERVPR